MPDSLSLFMFDPEQPNQDFPPLEQAWDEPNGLLAVGGDLSVPRLLRAYRSGIFPWFGLREPIYWWSPDPRAVLFPERLRISRSLRKSMRNRDYRVCFDRNFAEVVRSCAAPRSYSRDTWITPAMRAAYQRLRDAGVAHSVEVYDADDRLVGGLYGLAVGGVFCGESMFSRAVDSSKTAFVALAWHLQHWGFALIDCQLPNPHLMSLGVETIPRATFRDLLDQHAATPSGADWAFREAVDLSRWEPGG
ncbi:MAG TPA: leucyl/phenylalanyl-tRNA--protein transferase [Thiolinea sp.]|nr:leucyl/phenylalanyl-tRNA--protein transferase [Thiolinea sp.]